MIFIVKVLYNIRLPRDTKALLVTLGGWPLIVVIVFMKWPIVLYYSFFVYFETLRIKSVSVPSPVVFGWCSWLSRQSNTLEVPSSTLGSNILLIFHSNKTMVGQTPHASRKRPKNLRPASFQKTLDLERLCPRGFESHPTVVDCFMCRDRHVRLVKWVITPVSTLLLYV